MSQKPRARLAERVATAAESALASQKFVAPVDVLTGIGWLPWSLFSDWRRGRFDQLEGLGAVRADNLAMVLELLRAWAEARGLKPDEVTYKSGRRDRRQLRFTADGDSTIERLCRTHWSSPQLSDTARDRLTERQNRSPDLLAIWSLRGFTCTGCEGTDSLLIMEDGGPICLTCADMDHLLYLPAGDAALTRRAKKASGLSAVVVRFSRTRKRYERQGILVEESALEQAEQQCLADEEVRARRRERDKERRENEDVAFQARMAAEIVRLFPGCPVQRSDAIARHAGRRGSGRVGRTAAGRALDERAVTAAVIASVRHEDTAYDELLMSGAPRAEARDHVQIDVDCILDQWRAGAHA